MSIIRFECRIKTNMKKIKESWEFSLRTSSLRNHPPYIEDIFSLGLQFAFVCEMFPLTSSDKITSEEFFVVGWWKRKTPEKTLRWSNFVVSKFALAEWNYKLVKKLNWQFRRRLNYAKGWFFCSRKSSSRMSRKASTSFQQNVPKNSSFVRVRLG